MNQPIPSSIPIDVPVYEMSAQPGVFVWVEPVPSRLRSSLAFCIVQAREGFHATEACDDWFGDEAQANQVAQAIAEGKA